ncbi:hypothetical protein F5883DRAFT_584118, partial [Diaporthe sp. PMI_573]
APKSQLLALIHDMHRFARSYRGIIEKAPLQAYSSALIFSPTNSLTRNIFQEKGPGWIIRKPQSVMFEPGQKALGTLLI